MAQNRVQIQTPNQNQVPKLNDKKSLLYNDANAPQKDKKVFDSVLIFDGNDDQFYKLRDSSLLFRFIPFAIFAQKWYRIHIVGNDYQFNHWKFEGAAGFFAVLVTVLFRVDQINPDDQCCVYEAVGKLSFTSKVCPKSGPKKLESTTLMVNADNDESLILGEKIVGLIGQRFKRQCALVEP
jgi:hypothetical protein